MTSEKTWEQWANDAVSGKSAKDRQAAAIEQAVDAYRESFGDAATINELADHLYGIGDGTDADPLTPIAKDLWRLAEQIGQA